MRFIKQLGLTYFVYPGASHNRFEHSIGACHLAGEYIRMLQQRQPELDITAKDVLCVELAGLCHDLGHGPFSHAWEKRFMAVVKPENKFEHETVSTNMFEYIIQENQLGPHFEEHDLGEQDRTFIKELIHGASRDSVWKQKGRNDDKRFLYEIVANKENGIDVDKWDYFARDCHMLGMKNSFDHRRLMKTARVLEVEGERHICFREKNAGNLYDMFYVRQTLHRRAYQHKVSNIVEYMVGEALVSADAHLRFQGKDGPELETSRDILQKILLRKLYKHIGHTKPGHFKEEDLPRYKKEIVAEIKSTVSDQEINIDPDDFILNIVHFDYGMKDKNPIDGVWFYGKDGPNNPGKVDKHEVSRFLPDMFAEEEIHVYCKQSDNESLKNQDGPKKVEREEAKSR
ncbi:hypothetical protein ScPMuIL_009646 [Solemya velum]